MIYAVSGTVEHTEPNLAVIDTSGGVSYAVNTSLQTLARIKKGEKARLFTHLHLREAVCELYGFASREELASFRLLIGISGVGPKAAVSILSVGTPEKLALAVITGDEKALTGAPGVGKKLAQRIILELKDKLSRDTAAVSAGGSGGFAPEPGGAFTEAQAALCVLGYSPVEAAMAVKGLDEALPVEEIIRQALKRMSR
ncbi:MAG: Holliday junction branch migration protein RuvA [Oscillospiraceae bacterium]|jgi:Holliday junction DNA helicase RuvA|nr:Holliday junction branch migration protein RuvA [Oscillospiraceae bacterium]